MQYMNRSFKSPRPCRFAWIPRIPWVLCVVLAGPVAAQTRAWGPERVRDLAFSRDGQVLAIACGSEDTPGTIIAWEISPGRARWKHEAKSGFYDLNYSPDGRRLAAGTYSPEAVVLDAETGAPTAELKGAQASALSVVYGGDGQSIYVGCRDGKVRVYSAADARLTDTLDCHPEGVGRMSMSADGKWLAVAIQRGNCVVVWDVAAKAIEGTLEVGNQAVDVALTPDGSWLAVAGYTDELTLASMPLTQDSRKLTTNGMSPSRVVVSNDGAWLAIARGESVLVYPLMAPVADKSPARIASLIEAMDGDRRADRDRAMDELKAIGISAEQKLEVAMHQGSPEVRWRARRLSDRWQMRFSDATLLEAPGEFSQPLAFSDDDTSLAVGTVDGKVRIWNFADQTELVTLDVKEILRADRP